MVVEGYGRESRETDRYSHNIASERLQRPEQLRQQWSNRIQVNKLGFIEKGTGQHQSNAIYGINGISPCLNAVNYKEPIKVVCDE